MKNPVTNKGQQFVKATVHQGSPKTGKVKSGGDLRAKNSK